jgi:hypothetical protein
MKQLPRWRKRTLATIARACELDSTGGAVEALGRPSAPW